MVRFEPPTPHGSTGPPLTPLRTPEVSAGADPMQLQRGLMKASKLLAEEVKKVAVPVDDYVY